jgi:hypothetical protein
VAFCFGVSQKYQKPLFKFLNLISAVAMNAKNLDSRRARGADHASSGIWICNSSAS